MTTTRRLLGLVAPHWRPIALGVILAFLAVAANVILMATSAYLISKAAIVTNVAEIALAITAVRVLAIGRAAFRYLERYVTHRTAFRVLADLRVWFYRSIEPLAPARLAAHRSGDLLSRIVADIETLEDFYVRVVVPPIVAVLVVGLAGVLLGLLDPSLGILLAALLGLTAVALPVGTRRLARRPAVALIASRAELSAAVTDEVQGNAELVALDRAGDHRAMVLGLGAAVDRHARSLATIRGAGAGVAAGLASLTAVAVLAVAIGLVDGGRLDGVLLAVVPLVALASFEIVGPLTQAVQLQDANEAAARRLFELIDASPSVVDPPGPAPAPGDHGVEVRGLRFSYGPDEPIVLDGLDLTVPSGTSLALVGPSGSGKTTIVNLLLRFWEYREGEIKIGGHDLRDYPADAVRAMIGVVSQDVHLFNATIRDNLALADPDVTDEQVAAACRMACLDRFIASLPAGVETRVGENGVLLSGGERQRLAVARAIIKDAPILILDEATANLDVVTEAALLDSLGPFIAGRTTLVITHRADVARRMDRTVTIDAGRARPIRA